MLLVDALLVVPLEDVHHALDDGQLGRPNGGLMEKEVPVVFELGLR